MCLFKAHDDSDQDKRDNRPKGGIREEILTGAAISGGLCDGALGGKAIVELFGLLLLGLEDLRMDLL